MERSDGTRQEDTVVELHVHTSQNSTVSGLVDVSSKFGGREVFSPPFLEGADDRHHLDGLGWSSGTHFGAGSLVSEAEVTTY